MFLQSTLSFFALEFLQIEFFANRGLFLQSIFLTIQFLQLILHHHQAPLFILASLYSIQVSVPMQSEKMAAAEPNELQLELGEVLGEAERCLVTL